MEAHVSTAFLQRPAKWSPSSDASDTSSRAFMRWLHPRNIVLVGATDKPGNYAERIWNNLIKYKFEGGSLSGQLPSRENHLGRFPATRIFASLPDKAPITVAGAGAGALRRAGHSRRGPQPVPARRPS